MGSYYVLKSIQWVENYVSWPEGSEVANTVILCNIIASGQVEARRAYLDQLIPASADNHWILRVWREADTRNPLSMTLVSDREFAVS